MKLHLLLYFVPFLFMSCTQSSNHKKDISKVESINNLKFSSEQLVELFQSTNDTCYLTKAENALDSLIDSGIKDTKVYQLKGSILRKRKLFKEFAEFMHESTKQFPDNPQTFFGAGLAYEMINDTLIATEMFKKSIEAYDGLIERYPTIENYINRAVAVCCLNGKEEGLKDYELIVQSGKFEESSISIYKNLFLNFDKKKFISDTFRN